MSQSRKERREAAKKMGYLSKDNSFKNFASRIERSARAGDMIHQKHLEDQRWEIKKKLETKEKERIMAEISSSTQNKEQTFNFDTSSFDFLNGSENEGPQPE